MERLATGPVIIRFTDLNDMVDYTYRLELKYFLAKLLYQP